MKIENIKTATGLALKYGILETELLALLDFISHPENVEIHIGRVVRYENGEVVSHEAMVPLLLSGPEIKAFRERIITGVYTKKNSEFLALQNQIKLL